MLIAIAVPNPKIPSRTGRPILKLVVACALVGIGGCATVAPFEREELARPDMQFQGAPELGAAEVHATEVREGSIGGIDAAGGGCGCN